MRIMCQAYSWCSSRCSSLIEWNMLLPNTASHIYIRWSRVVCARCFFVVVSLLWLFLLSFNFQLNAPFECDPSYMFICKHSVAARSDWATPEKRGLSFAQQTKAISIQRPPRHSAESVCVYVCVCPIAIEKVISTRWQPRLEGDSFIEWLIWGCDAMRIRRSIAGVWVICGWSTTGSMSRAIQNIYAAVFLY